MCYATENSALALWIYALWKCVLIFLEPSWLLMWKVNKDESGKGAISPRSWECTMLPDWQLNLMGFLYLWWATESGEMELTGALPLALCLFPRLCCRKLSDLGVFCFRAGKNKKAHKPRVWLFVRVQDEQSCDAPASYNQDSSVRRPYCLTLHLNTTTHTGAVRRWQTLMETSSSR